MGEDENEVKEISEEEYEYGFGAEAREDAALEATAKALAEGEARGKAEGRAEGKAEGKAEVARAMLREELPLETICRVTGLTEAQVQNIARPL